MSRFFSLGRRRLARLLNLFILYFVSDPESENQEPRVGVRTAPPRLRTPAPNHVLHPPTPHSFRAWWTSSTGYVANPELPRESVTTAGWRGASQSPCVVCTLAGYPLRSGRFTRTTSIFSRTAVTTHPLHPIALQWAEQSEAVVTQ